MRDWLRKLFSESGEASMSRSLAAVALAASIGWVTYLVLKTKSVPELHGLAMYITAPYGLGKLGDVIAKFKGGGGENG